MRLHKAEILRIF